MIGDIKIFRCTKENILLYNGINYFVQNIAFFCTSMQKLYEYNLEFTS